jgi:hypothetical protein
VPGEPRIKFCSYDCFVEHRRERARQRWRAKQAKIGYKPPGECIICGNEFEAKRWASTRMLCSKICQNIHHMDRYYRPDVHQHERRRNDKVKRRIKAFRLWLLKNEWLGSDLPYEKQIKIAGRLARKMGMFDNQPVEQLRGWIISQLLNPPQRWATLTPVRAHQSN